MWPPASPEEALASWPDPENGPRVEPTELLAAIVAGSTSQHHPGFVGQQVSTVPPLAAVATMASALLNNSAAIFEGAPVGVAIERRIVEWMARKVGYPPTAGGTLTSGGSLGALTALLAMRQAKAGYDAWGDGLAGSERWAVLVSEEAHYANRRACAVLGLGDRAVVPVATDARFRMDLAAIRAALDEAQRVGRRPVAVVANAGSTATGSHDDLVAIGALCRERDLWLHVDAAHGGSALLSERAAGRLRGIELADSVVWDAHKLMQMPSLCTAVLLRDGAHLEGAFRQQASYLLADVEAPWHQPASRNVETTKPTMALPLYVVLRALGSGFFADCVDYLYDLAAAFAAEVERRDAFELLTEPESNIVCFRLRAPAGDDAEDDGDARQLASREAVNRRGRFFLMRTVLRGQVWLRVVLMNPATRLAHLRELLDELVAASR